MIRSHIERLSIKSFEVEAGVGMDSTITGLVSAAPDFSALLCMRAHTLHVSASRHSRTAGSGRPWTHLERAVPTLKVASLGHRSLSLRSISASHACTGRRPLC